jgi:hypothetical protein
MARTPQQTAPQGKYNISAKVSEKGAVSLYGLHRFPVTLYADQWTAVFSKMPEIQAFMVAHKSELKAKTESAGPAGTTAL